MRSLSACALRKLYAAAAACASMHACIAQLILPRCLLYKRISNIGSAIQVTTYSLLPRAKLKRGQADPRHHEQGTQRVNQPSSECYPEQDPSKVCAVWRSHPKQKHRTECSARASNSNLLLHLRFCVPSTVWTTWPHVRAGRAQQHAHTCYLVVMAVLPWRQRCRLGSTLQTQLANCCCMPRHIRPPLNCTALRAA